MWSCTARRQGAENGMVRLLKVHTLRRCGASAAKDTAHMGETATDCRTKGQYEE